MFGELRSELKQVLVKPGLAASLLPSVGFLVLTAWGQAGLGLVFGAVLGTWFWWREKKRKQAVYVGWGSLAVTAGMAWIGQQGRGLIQQEMISTGLFLGLSFFSLVVGKPLTAYASTVTRQWPLGWYWHSRIKPAYTETTWIWVGFFGIKLLMLGLAMTRLDLEGSAVVAVLCGWPLLVGLLVVTYVYGRWRLKNLSGPSVVEFRQKKKRPWKGQEKGF